MHALPHQRVQQLADYAYPITCKEVVRDASGAVVELRCKYDKDYRAPGKKVPKGVLNWVTRPAPGKEPATVEVSSRRGCASVPG